MAGSNTDWWNQDDVEKQYAKRIDDLQQGRRPFKGTSLAASVLCTGAAVGNLNVAIKNGAACFLQAEAGVPLIVSHPADFLALLVSATFTVLLIIVAVNSYRRFAGSEEAASCRRAGGPGGRSVGVGDILHPRRGHGRGTRLCKQTRRSSPSRPDRSTGKARKRKRR